jgi:superoxide oxidase
MASKSTRDRYAASAMAFHWVMLALVVTAYTLILLRKDFPPGSNLREGLRAWHYMVGLSIFGLATVRLALRVFVWRTPTIHPPPPRYLVWLSIGAHAAIYLMLVAMPISGWLILSVEGRAVPFWGVNLPPLTGVDARLGMPLEELHELGGMAGYFLLGFHAAAALIHHFVMKDNTLLRMLPPGR